MNYIFVNDPLVDDDIIEAVHYYKKYSDKLVKQFLFRLREAKQHISLSPLGFQIKYKNVRTLLLKHFHIIFITLLTKTKNKLSL